MARPRAGAARRRAAAGRRLRLPSPVLTAEDLDACARVAAAVGAAGRHVADRRSASRAWRRRSSGWSARRQARRRRARTILVIGDRRVGPSARADPVAAGGRGRASRARPRAGCARAARWWSTPASRARSTTSPAWSATARTRSIRWLAGDAIVPALGQGPAEGDVQDGRLDRLRLPRRAGVRGDRARAGADRAPLHRHAVQARRDRAARARARGARAPRAHATCRPAGSTAGAATASATAGTRTRSPPCSAASGGATSRPSDAAARHGALRGQLGVPRRDPIAAGGRRAGDRDHEALRHRRDVARLDLARGARVARAGDERDRRALEHRRGRRGPGALRRRRGARRSSRSRPPASA